MLGLGADAFVDADRDDVATSARDADLLFDLIGGQTFARVCSSLRNDATAVSAVEATAASTDGRGPRGLFFVVQPNRAQLSELGRRIAARELRPVGAVMPLAQGGAAFAAKQRGSSPGKVVLEVANDPR